MIYSFSINNLSFKMIKDHNNMYPYLRKRHCLLKSVYIQSLFNKEIYHIDPFSK